jgi:CheY-like chemotaxis protein
VVCVVCADIDRVDHLVEKLGTTPRALAPWSEIKRHLHESERVLAEIKTAALRDSLGRLRETTEAVLGIIVHEVSGCGSTRLLLDLSGEDLSYAPFEGGTAEVRGYLHGMLRPGIAEVVREPRVALVLPDGSPCAVTIERESGDERYILGWPEARRSLGGASPTRQGSSPLPHRAPDTTRGSIFVIDDDPTFRDVLRRFLERHRFSVQPFSSADEAWQALQDGAELDLIICDVHMPGMSGYDFIRRLRATSAGRGVPLVALTSASDVDVEIELIEAGVAAFVSKGADPRILCAHVERLCEERSRSEPRCSE